MCTLTAIVTGRLVRGSHPRTFANRVATLTGRRFAVPLNRARFGIQLILGGLGIGRGDEVIVPAYICDSVIEAIVATGAHPAFADVADDLQISPDAVLAAVNKRTRCVVVAHLFGRAAPISAIESALRGTGIHVIDDAAQSFGATCDGRPVGSFGVAAVVGCGSGKSLAGAAGAVLLTDDSAIYDFARANAGLPEKPLHVFSRLSSYWIWRRFRRQTFVFEPAFRKRFPESTHIAGPCPASNVDAALAECQIRALSKNAAARRRNSARIAPIFTASGFRVLSTFAPTDVALKLVVMLPESAPPINDVIEIMGTAGIECQQGYVPYYVAHRDLPYLADATQPPLTNRLWPLALCIPVDRPMRVATLEAAIRGVLSLRCESAS